MQIVNVITDLKNKYFLLKFNNLAVDDVSRVRNTGIVKDYNNNKMGHNNI